MKLMRLFFYCVLGVIFWINTAVHAAVVLSPQLGHSGAVIGLDVSPDGRVLATAGSDRTVRLWDTATQRELRVLIGHTKDLRQVRFAPNGRWLASAGKDATVRVSRIRQKNRAAWKVVVRKRIDKLFDVHVQPSPIFHYFV